MTRWQTSTRYYCATMYRDLLGDLVVATAHGGLWNNLGTIHVHPVKSAEEGRALLEAIAKKRGRRKYRLVH